MNRADLIAALLLGTATVAYLHGLPHNLGAVDEANFIYQANRLADGEVMYRDVFDLITPLSMYLTAFSFSLFGADMGVARATIAVVHAVLVVGIYACCRRVDVHPALAGAVALVHLVIGQPTWPYVSQHWFASALNILVLLSVLSCRWDAQPLWAAVPGAVTGVLIGIQQQKGVPIVAAAGVIFVAAHLLTPAGQRRSWRWPAIQMGYFAAGLAAVVIPLFLWLIATAGIEALVRALIVFPLVNYARTYRSAWGGIQFFSSYYASFTFPTLLTLAPLSLVPIVIRAVGIFWHRRNRPAAQPLVILLVFTLSTMASIAYYPDVIHLAFIASIFLVVAAEGLTWALRGIVGPRIALASTVIAVCLIGAVAVQLRVNWQRVWGLFPVAYDTAFGRMDFGNRDLIPMIEKARALLAASPVQEMFCYPSISGPYLWTGAKNPTPYQYFSPTYNDRRQVQEIIATLEARRTPFVITSTLMARAGDPIVDYIAAHYDAVPLGYLPKMRLATRRADATP